MSGLNPNAKPFKFNPNKRSFIPKAMRKTAAPAADASAPFPAESKDSAPATAPATAPVVENKVKEEPKAESWETAADNEEVPGAKSVPAPTKPDPTMPKAVPKPDPNPSEKKSSTSKPSTSKSSTSEKKSSKKSSKQLREEERSSADNAKIAELNKNGITLPKGIEPHDTRPHVNIVFIGHVDAGKSTLSGQILLKTGQVDQRTIEKFEREAKEKNRESWYLAFIMDTNEEERAKGKTVEVGRAHFCTEKKRYTLLDAPGHKNYVPNMIAGAAQADIGVLIISARKSEFEAGFDRGGQTREHAMLAKTLGISRLVVAINKMDESTVLWSQKRYDQIIKKLSPFLKKWFKPKDTTFLPVSAFTGANLMKPVSKELCPWYGGKCLMEVLDDIKTSNRDRKAGLRIPVMDKYKEMGTICALGKVEAGTLYKGQKVKVMPMGGIGECVGIIVNDESVNMALPGENVVIQTKGLDENELLSGFVICEPLRPCKKCTAFEAQIRITELLMHKPLMTNGYRCILHCHTIVAECVIAKMIATLDRKSGEELEKKPKFVKKNRECTLNA